MKDKIYLDEKGYYDYLDEIETLKEQLVNMKAARFGLKSIYTDPDSLSEALEEHKRQEIRLSEKIAARKSDLKRIVIVARDLGSSEVIDINDTVNVLLDGDEMTFTLVTGTPDFDAEIPKITVNSPLGKAVYLKEVGYIGSYTVGNRTNNVEIVSKEKEVKLELK